MASQERESPQELGNQRLSMPISEHPVGLEKLQQKPFMVAVQFKLYPLSCHVAFLLNDCDSYVRWSQVSLFP